MCYWISSILSSVDNIVYILLLIKFKLKLKTITDTDLIFKFDDKYN